MTRAGRRFAAFAIVGFGALTARLGVASPDTPAATAAPSPAAATQAPATQFPTSPSPLPTVQPPPTPFATPTPVYHFVYRPTPIPSGYASPPPAAPQIAEIDVNEQSLSAPGPIHVRILTNGVVNSVTAKTLGQSYAIPHTAFGEFLLDAEIPPIPFWMFLHGKTFDITFAAATQEGREADIVLPFYLR